MWTRRAAAARLDRIAVAHREETGRFLLQALEQVSEVEPDETEWSLRRTIGPSESVLLGFGACSSAAVMDADLKDLPESLKQLIDAISGFGRS